MTHQAVKNKNEGKRVQALLVRRLGGKNVGTIENQDGSHPIWSIEIKKRKTFIGVGFMEQAIRNSPEGKTPLVVVHQTGQRHDNDLVMMRLGDFEDWFGRVYAEKIREKDNGKR